MMDNQRATLEQAENKCREIARLLKNIMPDGWGFTLLLNSYGEGGFTTYLSSCQRADMIKSLRETADRLENDPRQYHRTERKP